MVAVDTSKVKSVRFIIAAVGVLVTILGAILAAEGIGYLKTSTVFAAALIALYILAPCVAFPFIALGLTLQLTSQWWAVVDILANLTEAQRQAVGDVERYEAGAVFLGLGPWISWAALTPADALDKFKSCLSGTKLVALGLIALHILALVIMWSVDVTVLLTIALLIFLVVFVTSAVFEQRLAGWIVALYGANFQFVTLDQAINGCGDDSGCEAGSVLMWFALLGEIAYTLYLLPGPSAQSVVDGAKNKARDVRFLAWAACLLCAIVGAICIGDPHGWRSANAIFAILFIAVAWLHADDRQLGFGLLALGLFLVGSGPTTEIAHNQVSSPNTDSTIAAGACLLLIGLWFSFLVLTPVPQAKEGASRLTSGTPRLIATVSMGVLLLGVILIWAYIDDTNSNSDVSTSMSYLHLVMFIVFYGMYMFECAPLMLVTVFLVALFEPLALQSAIDVVDSTGQAGFGISWAAMIGLYVAYVMYFWDTDAGSAGGSSAAAGGSSNKSSTGKNDNTNKNDDNNNNTNSGDDTNSGGNDTNKKVDPPGYYDNSNDAQAEHYPTVPPDTTGEV